jgi:hypothetical protein
MARRTGTAVRQYLEAIPWVYWQTLRRHSLYRPELARLLRSLRRTRGRRIAGVINGVRVVLGPTKKAAAATDALAAYRILEVRAREGHPLRASDGRVALLTTEEILGRLPELRRFGSRWGLRFPVPPRSMLVPKGFVTAECVTPLRSRAGERGALVLRLWRPAGKDVLLECLRGELDYHQLHRAGPKFRRVSKKAGSGFKLTALPLGEWLEVRITNPEVANFESLRLSIPPLLGKSTLNLRQREYNQEVFAVRDLSGRGLSRQRIAHVLAECGVPKPSEVLDAVLGSSPPPPALTRRQISQLLRIEGGDPNERGPVTVDRRNRAYKALVKQLGLPALRSLS